MKLIKDFFFQLQQPRKALLEQLGRVLPTDSDSLPDQLILANTCKSISRKIKKLYIFVIIFCYYLSFKKHYFFFR